MAISNFTSDLPLIIVGTETLTNPSFEDFNGSTAIGWTGTATADTQNTFPQGERSASIAGSLSQSLSIASFRLSTFPAWADAFVAAACVYSVAGGTASIQIAGGSAGTRVVGAGLWSIVYCQHSAVGAVTLSASAGTIVFDNVMAGFGLDVPIPFAKWNPVPKFKGESRESPYRKLTQMVSDAWDLKATLGHCDAAFKTKLVGAIRYLQRGHYYAAILERGYSLDQQDEICPYISFDSQDSPTFMAGAPGVFQMSFNGRGNLP